MKEDLIGLLEKSRRFAAQISSEDVLKKCKSAARQEGAGRIRMIAHSQNKSRSPAFGGRSIKWADFQSALISTVEAMWQEEHGTWKLSGGVDRDGDSITVAVVVLAETEDVYIWTGF